MWHLLSGKNVLGSIKRKKGTVNVETWAISPISPFLKRERDEKMSQDSLQFFLCCLLLSFQNILCYMLVL